METRSNMLTDLAHAITDRLSSSAGSQLVFGTPQQQGDQTVIPVAEARYNFGFGAGSGSGSGPNTGSGGGGGGGGSVRTRPVGYIRLQGNAADFVPIIDYTKIILASLICVLIAGLAVARVRGGGTRSRRR